MSEQILGNPHPNPALNPAWLPDLPEDFMLLMSLRLDNLLDKDEEQQFQTMLHTYPACARAWTNWQQLHQRLVDEPAMLPPLNFVQNVETCLLQYDRRNRLWQGLLIGVLVVLMWGGLLATTIGLGAYVLFYQSNLLGDLIQHLALFSSAVANHWATARNAVYAFFATPQATALAIGYVALAAILLSLWVRFLRRSLEGGEVRPLVGS